MWKVYSAFKKSTREEASVFVLEKRLLEQWARRDRDTMLDTLRQGVSQLTRLRHPRVLTVQHAMEESRWVAVRVVVGRRPRCRTGSVGVAAERYSTPRSTAGPPSTVRHT